MALIRCSGQRISVDEIKITYESGYTAWNATIWGEAQLDLSKNIRPITIELHAKRVLGTATWAGNCWIQLLAYNTANSTWEEIAPMIKDGTFTYDVSDRTTGKYYSKLKIRVGGTSSNGTVNHIGYAKIKRYFVR